MYTPLGEDKETLLETPSTPLTPFINQNNKLHGSTSHSRYRNALHAAPPILAGFLWFSMMLYFFVYYQTLPRNNEGNLPRIGEAYSTFPYISCIGAVRLLYFRGFACIVAPLVSLSFFLDFWIGRNVVPGRWFRRAKLCFGIISSIFLGLLSFESVNNGNHLHLIFTSIQIWGMGAAKLRDYFMSYRVRRHDRKNSHLLFAKLWKKCIGIVAAPASTINLIGIYGCVMPVGLLPATVTCYKISTYSAPSEWILSLCWISYLFAVGYDLYHAEQVAEEIIPITGRRGHDRSRSAAMRTLRLAKVLDSDVSGSDQTTQYAMPMNSKYASVRAQEMEDERDDEFELGLDRGSRWVRPTTKEFV